MAVQIGCIPGKIIMASRIALGAAAVWVITSVPPINNIPVVASARRAVEGTSTVLFKTAKGTGR